MQNSELDKDLVLVYDVAKAFFESTGEDFWELEPTRQRKLLEEEHERLSR